MKKLAFFTLLLLLGTACPPSQPNDSEKVLEVKYGETAEAPGEKMKLTFSEANDSRCPKDVQCVTAGEARVTLAVAKGGATETIELTAKGLCFEEDGACGSEAAAMGYRFKLLSLNPYPEQNVMPNPEDYVVKVAYSVFQTN
ncbi:MAG: hypothetical protein H6557_35975 [Lewinellaceae bacterium]|nr:hypothetical protein [Phaeodactylibacter sp.]MCB9042046.1 hypothetical protein [Lewinellaceae bacterium]